MVRLPADAANDIRSMTDIPPFEDLIDFVSGKNNNEVIFGQKIFRGPDKFNFVVIMDLML